MSENRDSLGEDLRAFFAALREHWMWWVAGSFPAAVVAVYQGGGGVIPAWCLWTWAILGILAAAFLAWRDEHQKVKCKSLRAILTKVVDAAPYLTLYEGDTGNVTSRLETIGALISVCDEFGDESDVEWVCEQLETNSEPDRGDPFLLYESFYGAGAFKGKRLKFLQDARVSSGRYVKNDIDAIGYIRTFWGAKNGLRQINRPIYPVKIVNGRLEYQEVLCRPLPSAKEAPLYLIPPTIQLDGEDQPISTPLGLPKRPSQPEAEIPAEDDFATLFVPDPSGSIPGVAKRP